MAKKKGVAKGTVPVLVNVVAVPVPVLATENVPGVPEVDPELPPEEEELLLGDHDEESRHCTGTYLHPDSST